MSAGSYPLVPGLPVAGHVTTRGFWHPGRADGCAKCEAGDDLLGYAEISQRTGIGVATLRKYKSDGHLPPPDAPGAPDRPRWRRSTVERWLRERPGKPGRPRNR
jgi:predicted DNA-binding transcriptional regulator AlpA